jgi:hypothetical protein
MLKVNSSKFLLKSPLYTRECQADKVHSHWTLSGWTRHCLEFKNWDQRLVSWESPINIPPPPMALSLGHYILLVLKFISFILKGLKHSPPEISLQVLDIGIEWSQDPSFVCESHPQACLGYWIFILHTFYSWSFAPRRLEVSLKLPLYVVRLRKFVLPILW